MKIFDRKLLLFSSLTLSYAASSFAAGGWRGETTDALRVRFAPDAKAKVIGKLPKGAAVTGKESGEWLEIPEGQYRGKFVARAFLKDAGAPAPQPPGTVANPAAAAASPRARIEANRALNRALSADLLTRKDYVGAEDLLVKHLGNDAEDAAAWNTLGLARLELGNFTGAEEAFRKAGGLAAGEDQAIYLYNAADAANRAGSVDTARSSLSLAEQASLGVAGVVGEQIARIRNVIRSGEPLPALRLGAEGEAKSGFTGNIALRSGFDSNVMLLPNDVRASLAPSSALAGLTGQVAYQRPLGDGAFAASSATAFTFYTASPVRGFNNLSESLNVSYSPAASAGGKFTSTYGNRADLTFLNTDGLEFFSWTDSLYATLAYRFSEDTALVADLPVGYQRFPGVVADPADERDGWLITPSLLMKWKLGAYSLSSGLTYQEVWAEGTNYRSRAGGLLAGVSRTLPWEISARLGAGFTRTFYHESANGRADSKIDASLSFAKLMPFDKRMSVSADYIFGKNFSNLPSASYVQHSAFIQVNYALP